MKKINKSTLKARMDGKQLLLDQACFLEDIENQGKSSEFIINKAKAFLEISENDSVIALHKDAVAGHNKLANAVVALNNSLSLLTDIKALNPSELEVFKQVHDNLLDKICKLYDISKSELLEE